MKYKNLAYSWAYALLNPNSRTKHLWQIPKFNSIKSSVQKTQINSIRKKNLFQIRIHFGVQIRKRKNIFLIKKNPFRLCHCLHATTFQHFASTSHYFVTSTLAEPWLDSWLCPVVFLFVGLSWPSWVSVVSLGFYV